MNWIGNDMDTYLQQKEYIDTLVLPLMRIEPTVEKMKTSASATEFMMHVSQLVERQFKGRMVFTPPFCYTSDADVEWLSKTTLQAFQEAPFQHYFFLTTDPIWLKQSVPGEVIWLPSIPLEHMDPSLRQSVLEDQLRKILPRFIEQWSK